MTPQQALEEAIRQVGMAEMARRAGVTVQAVWQWQHRSKRLPPYRAIQIEEATGGRVTKHQLRPDIFGASEAA